MRKKLALLLAAIMVIGMIPMTAFATTTNRISNIASGDTDTDLTDKAPELKMYEKDLQGGTSDTAFELDLANAEWLDSVFTGVATDGTVTISGTTYGFIKGMSNVKITKLSAKNIIITGDVDNASTVDGKQGIIVKMLTSLTDEGDATVTIDPMDSVISSGTYKFATVASGSATVTIEKKTDISESGGAIKNVVIKETNAGALESGTLKFKLSSNWTYMGTPTVTVYPSKYQSYFDGTATGAKLSVSNDNQLEIVVPSTFTGSDTAMTITVASSVQYDDDKVDSGDVADMTVSGCNVTKTTLEVATAVTYGVTFVAEDATVPTYYSGTANPDNDTLKVTMKETVKGSWLTSRKTKIVFPTGVKVLGVSPTVKDGLSAFTYTIDNQDDHGEVKISGTATGTAKAKVELKFQLSYAPSFTGDVVATLTGAGVDQEVSATVATVAAPVKVTATSTDAVIDYRHTAIGDITITEAEAGLLKSGTTLALKIEDLGFDDDPTVTVESGDLTIDKVTTDNNIVKIKIDDESAKAPAVIKLTKCELYMDRTIPAGTYALKLTASKTHDYSDVKNGGVVCTSATDPSADEDTEIVDYDQYDSIFQNSVTSGSKYDNTPLFDSRNITVVKDYVNVVTAGRDKDDSTFTTTIKVTVGANSMTANDATIPLDVPAYISNGYTMLPVRAVTEALSNAAIVRWDDATKTVTITFGARVISMTVGSRTMTINGVEVAMQAQCEITNNRAFIPLRDMGYALGLNDSKINWDDATKTATLN